MVKKWNTFKSKAVLAAVDSDFSWTFKATKPRNRAASSTVASAWFSSSAVLSTASMSDCSWMNSSLRISAEIHSSDFVETGIETWKAIRTAAKVKFPLDAL